MSVAERDASRFIENSPARQKKTGRTCVKGTAINSGFWIAWYNLPEQGRDQYLAWLHASYIPRVLARSGVTAAAHYASVDAPRQRKNLSATTDAAVPAGDRYILVFEGATPYTFAGPMPSRYHETLPEGDRAMLAIRIGARSNVMTIEHEVRGPDTPDTGDLPLGPAIQLGNFNSGSWQDEDELADWYSQWRLPSLEKMKGCIRVRKLVSISGWAKHAILHEFISVEARNANYIALEKNNPEMDRWSEEVVNKLVHAPGSPNVAKRIWPAIT